jgi:hypothetical protein
MFGILIGLFAAIEARRNWPLRKAILDPLGLFLTYFMISILCLLGGVIFLIIILFRY